MASQRHARDVDGFAGQHEEHVLSSLVTPKVRKIKSASLLDFRPQVGATILQNLRVLGGQIAILLLRLLRSDLRMGTRLKRV